MDTRIVYLSSQYPAVSHTFILREVRNLRSLGVQVATASMRPARDLEKMTETDREEAGNTFYIQSSGPGRILLSLFAVFLGGPPDFCRVLARSAGLLFRGPKSPIKAVGYFVEAVVLVRWMRKQGAGHVHVHFANPSATVAMLASGFRGVSYSLSVHGPDAFLDAETNLLGEKFDGASFVRCISSYCRSQVYRLLPPAQYDKVFVVPLGVDVDKFRPARGTAGEGPPHVLCVGRLVPQKGHRILLEACRQLKRRGIEFRATFIGDGPEAGSLKELARGWGLEEVNFAGALGQDKVREAYATADLFVLSSFNEGLPVVLMEAMAMGIPVISSRIDGIPELITDGEDGFLVPASDPELLADRMESLIREPELRRAFGVKGREFVSREFNLVVNCRKMAESLKSRLEPGRAPAGEPVPARRAA